MLVEVAAGCGHGVWLVLRELPWQEPPLGSCDANVLHLHAGRDPGLLLGTVDLKGVGRPTAETGERSCVLGREAADPLAAERELPPGGWR